jgi:tetratricopeptide (TPR) repeat protein
VSRALVLAAVVALASVAAPVSRARAEEPVRLLPWESEVEHETEAQTREIEEARQRHAVASVVTKYASRASRDPSALNHYLLGRAQYYNQDPVAARNQMTAALTADSGFWYAHLKLAVLYAELKNPSEAQAQVEAALAAKPGYPETMRLAANLAIDAKDWPRARRILEEMASRNPSDVEVRGNLVTVLIQLEDWEGAEHELRVVRGRDPGNARIGWLLGYVLWRKGDAVGARKELEEHLTAHPGDVKAAKLLFEICARARDVVGAQAVYDKVLPQLSGKDQQAFREALDALRKGPAPKEDRPPTWEEVLAATRSEDADRRKRALQYFYQGLATAQTAQVPTEVRRRIVEDVEPEWQCRAWVVKIEGLLGPRGLVNLARALYDPRPEVRSLAAEVIGDVGHPTGMLYLFPHLFNAPGGSDADPGEVDTIRAALDRLAGRQSEPVGRPVTTKAEVEATRDDWRRWSKSDASTPVKLQAIEGLAKVGEPMPERYLVAFVADGSYDVFRAAYAAILAGISRAPNDPVERKTFPRFPRFADADVTPTTMRRVQDRVVDWWNDWIAERKAWLKEREAGGGK